MSLAPVSEPAGKHSRLPPSSSGRWVHCTASIGFIEANADRIPEQDWTHANRGTRAHDAGAQLILDPKAKVVVDDPEMRDCVTRYAEFVRTKISTGDRVLIEKKVRLFYLPSEKGTTDAAIIGPKSIYIADYKDGVGVGVYARGNTQLAIYAESLIQELELIDAVPDDTLVTLAIFQPRDRGDSNPIRLWSLTRKELSDFCAPISVARDHIHSSKVDREGVIVGPAKFKAGLHCDKSFCSARGLCKAYGAQGLEALSDEPVDTVIESGRGLTQLTSPQVLTRAQRQKVIAAKKTLVAWLEAVENQEVAELMHGADPLQFKLVKGKADRQWVSEEGARYLLGTVLPAHLVVPPVTPEIVSPAQAEKLLKGVTVSEDFGASLSALIYKPEGSPTLVPVTDKRPALSFNPTEGLSEIVETDASALI